jgi:hypothetical protein
MFVGLYSKSTAPEFQICISYFDIISCCETHLDDLDVIKFENYYCIFKDRKQTVARKSGGIATFVKSYFTQIDTECEYVQWFKLSKCLFETDEDVIFGSVYIPPENTKYFDKNIYDLFYTENFCTNYKHIVTFGDFNARTGNVDDILQVVIIEFQYNNIFDVDIFNELRKMIFL